MQSTVHINHLDQNTNTSGGIYVIYVMRTEQFYLHSPLQKWHQLRH